MDSRVFYRLEPSPGGHSEIRLWESLPLGRPGYSGRTMAEAFEHQGPSLPRIPSAAAAVRIYRENPHPGRPRHSRSKTKRSRAERDQFSGARSTAAVRIQEIRSNAELR